MKLNQFGVVVAIGELGSIRAAARQLNMGQPAITRCLAELERELGVPLFERLTRGVSPTAFGRNFIARATSILNEIKRARDEIDQMRGQAKGVVRVGLSFAAHLTLLPSAIQPFLDQFPRTQLNIIEGFYTTLSSGLVDGTIDFYMGQRPRTDIASCLNAEFLFKETRTVLCRNKHRLATATSLAQLVDVDWLATSIAAEAEDELETVFREHNLPPPRLAVRSQSALTLLTCLSNSDIIAMAPSQWADFPLAQSALTSIKVKEGLAAPDIVLIRRPDLPLTPAVTYLLDLIRRPHPYTWLGLQLGQRSSDSALPIKRPKEVDQAISTLRFTRGERLAGDD